MRTLAAYRSDRKAELREQGLRRRGQHLLTDQEITPQGASGLTLIGGDRDLTDCLAVRTKPWRLVIWEPLLTKAPAPPKAAAYCCYIKTVVFYVSPYTARPFKRLWRAGNGRLQACEAGFEQWDQIETRLSYDDVVKLEGERFQIQGGRVVWAKRRWWMCRVARRFAPALPIITGGA